MNTSPRSLALLLPARLSVAALLMSSAASSLHAQLTDRTWQGAASANWFVAGNWSGGLPDTTSERAVINASGSPVILNVSPSIGGLSIASGFTLTRSAGDTTARTITLAAATLTDTFFSNAGTISTGGISGLLTLSIAQTAGTITNTGIIEATTGTELRIRSSTNNNLAFNNTGGTLRTVGTGILHIGTATSNSLNITGGSVNNAGTLNQALLTTYTDTGITNAGTYTVSTPVNAGNPWGMRLSGTSTLNNSGTMNFFRNIDPGSAANQANTFTLNSTSTALTNSGTINIITEGIPLSGAGGASMTVAVDSTITNTGTINIESRSTTNSSRFTVNTDMTTTLTGTGTLVLTVGTGGSASLVQVTGGTNSTLVNASGHTIRGAGQLGNNTLDVITNAGTIHADSSTASLTINTRGALTAGTFTNTGTLRASGAGGLIITDGTNTNSGLVRVDTGSSLTVQGGAFSSTAGTLQFDGSFINTPDLAISGGTLTGQGSISGNVSVSGPMQIAPGGADTHTLSIGGNLSFTTAGSPRTIALSFSHAADVLDVTGLLTQGGNNLFEFTFANNALYTTATTFNLITTGGTDLDLNSLSVSATSLSAGYVLDSTFGTNGWQLSGDDLQVRFSSVAAIPEPAHIALLAGMFGCAAAVSRRRRTTGA